jgi:hypothetical protein
MHFSKGFVSKILTTRFEKRGIRIPQPGISVNYEPAGLAALEKTNNQTLYTRRMEAKVAIVLVFT